jgi:DNA-binding GntR family transcriptional regulator
VKPELETLIADARAAGLTSAEAAAHALREAILRGVLVGGQPLRQDDIAARFGVSKIPLREALRRLEAEGLVAFYPNRGAVVTTLSADEAEELGEIRTALETTALRRAIPRMTTDDLRRAQDILDEARHEPDAARWSALNREFHEALYAPAGRPQLLELIRRIHRRVDRYMYVTLTDAGHQAQSLREHKLLLQAARRGDAAAAEAVLVEHIAVGAERLIDYLRGREKRVDSNSRE